VCRAYARRSLESLALRVEPHAAWEDLILPELQIDTLRQLVAQVRQRFIVHDAWGFAGRYGRGLGVTALFAGPSGTGKTMAAEVLAAGLQMDLFQIDLAAVVSKYIGETEKNLRRVFDAAEESGAVLLFDEADALFGKRSEVRDSHDRYANLEISYLLQRMESYNGLAVLTTNMRHALDTAFLRRIRFIVQFPFPDGQLRQRIWERVFPAETPVGALDYARLAQLNVSGGIIRNIATHAAFLAADAGAAVEMAHVLRASKVEYAKLDKPLTAAELGGWA
jgi:SpoVK/Ycf46/Vps4 family AAA+-type ATPase